MEDRRQETADEPPYSVLLVPGPAAGIPAAVPINLQSSISPLLPESEKAFAVSSVVHAASPQYGHGCHMRGSSLKIIRLKFAFGSEESTEPCS